MSRVAMSAEDIDALLKLGDAALRQLPLKRPKKTKSARM